MFIREAKTKRDTKKLGEVEYRYLKLLESYRTEKGPRQRLVLNLGPLPLKKDEYKPFVMALEARMTGQKSLIRKQRRDSQFMGMVNEAYEKLMRKKAEPIKPSNAEDVRNIDVKSHKITHPKSIGPEYLCHSVWKALKMDTALKSHDVSADKIALIEGLVLGRLIEPGSELACKDWLENRSGLFELNQVEVPPTLMSYYRTGDSLYELKESIEKHLREREKTLFKLSDTIVLYDLTNTYFEGSATTNAKAKRGRSKEKRSDCPLVTLGLVIDQNGFAKYSKTFSGNVSEGKTLEEIMSHLDESYQKEEGTKKTVVLDAGIATSDNIAWLREKEYHYIVCYRGSCPFDPKDSKNQEVMIESDGDSKVEIKTIKHAHEGDLYLWCQSEKRKEKEKSMRSTKEEKLLELLRYYKEGLSKPRRIKTYSKVLECVGRLKERYAYAAKLYTIDVVAEPGKAADDPTLRAIDLKWSLMSEKNNKEQENQGSYVLRTDQTSLSNKQIWDTYVMLTRVETAFRNMKSHLGFRPIFHRTEKRTDAHLFISVIAYHILHIIEYTLRQNKDHRSWPTIRKALSTHQAVILEYDELSDSNHWVKHHTKMCSDANEDQKNIYKMFGLPSKPFSKKSFSKQK